MRLKNFRSTVATVFAVLGLTAPSALGARQIDAADWQLITITHQKSARNPLANVWITREKKSLLGEPGQTLILSNSANTETSYHYLQPRKMLTENQRWIWSKHAHRFSADLTVKDFPKSGSLVLVEIADSALRPYFRLLMPNSQQIYAVICQKPLACTSTLAGALPLARMARIEVHTFPDGRLTTDVNGTLNVFDYPSDRLTQPVSFYTGAYVIGHASSRHEVATLEYTRLHISH